MQKLTQEDMGNEAFRFFAVREMALGQSPAIIARAGFTGELGYEFGVTPDYLETLCDEGMAAGEDYGIQLFGGRALSSLRLEKNYGSFNKDFRPDYTAGETGLDAFVEFGKPDFMGKQAAVAEKEMGPQRRFVTFVVDAPHADVIGYEVVLKDGEPVGYCTSGSWGHTVGRSLAAGYVPAELAMNGERFAIDILGEHCPAVVTARALHDPDGTRLRS
jgi:dimethylglycine dehydrogenase